MVDIKNLFSNGGALLKLILSAVCLLGSIAATSAYLPYSLSKHIMIEIALCGGCVVAISLFMNYVVNGSGDRVTELIFGSLYALFNIIAAVLMLIYVASDDDDYHKTKRNVGTFLVTGASIAAAVLFIFDIIRNI